MFSGSTPAAQLEKKDAAVALTPGSTQAAFDELAAAALAAAVAPGLAGADGAPMEALLK